MGGFNIHLPMIDIINSFNKIHYILISGRGFKTISNPQREMIIARMIQFIEPHA